MAKHPEKFEDEDPHNGSTGIRSRVQIGNEYINCTFAGLQTGIDAEYMSDNKLTNVSFLSTEAFGLVNSIKYEIQNSKVDDQIKRELTDKIDDIVSSSEPLTALKKYASLMSSLNDHASLLTLAIPLIHQLGAALAA